MRTMMRIGICCALLGTSACSNSHGGAAGRVERDMDRGGDATRRGLEKAGDSTGRALDKAMDKTGEGVGKAIDKTGEGLEKAGEKLRGED
jgi:hypothetical protein